MIDLFACCDFPLWVVSLILWLIFIDDRLFVSCWWGTRKIRVILKWQPLEMPIEVFKRRNDFTTEISISPQIQMLVLLYRSTREQSRCLPRPSPDILIPVRRRWPSSLRHRCRANDGIPAATSRCSETLRSQSGETCNFSTVIRVMEFELQYSNVLVLNFNFQCLGPK